MDAARSVRRTRDGAIAVVRPDQYVAGVLPLSARDEFTEVFAGVLRDQRALVA